MFAVVVTFTGPVMEIFRKTAKNFKKSAFEGKRLFALLNYSKFALKTATLEKFATNPSKIIFFRNFRAYFLENCALFSFYAFHFPAN